MRNALIVFPSPCSPRAWRASRSWRSRFTRANSEATKNPVPTVRARPTPTINQSNHKVHRPTGRATRPAQAGGGHRSSSVAVEFGREP